MSIEWNHIYNQSCLEGLKQIPDQSVSLVVADPPYFMGLTHNGQKGTFEDLELSRPFFEQLSGELARILEEDGEFYIFTDWRGYAFYYPIFAADLPVRNLIVWDKMTGCGSYYTYNHELILYGGMNPKNIKKGANIWRERGFNSGALYTDGPKLHPTQKPVALIRRMIQNQGRPGSGVIADPFMGSGTTAVAAIREGRPYIGFEINPRYCKRAEQRIREEAGQVEQGKKEG